MKRFQLSYCFLVFFVSKGMECFEKYDTSVETTHTSYPDCVIILVGELSRYGATCDSGCYQILLQDPSYLEEFIKIESVYLSPQAKKAMLLNICKTECSACRYAMTKELEI